MVAPLALVVCGVSGAGKTTVGRMLAERLGWAFLDADDFHPQANVEKMARGEPLADEDRGPWLDTLARLLAKRVAAVEPVVLACSALRQAYRDRLGVDQRRILSVYLQASRPLIAARIAKRDHTFMPASLLQSQFDTLEPPTDGIRVCVDADPVVICQRVMDVIG